MTKGNAALNQDWTNNAPVESECFAVKIQITLTYHAKMLLPTNDKATFIPTSMPEPINAGVHSRNHPQLSIDKAAWDPVSRYSQVNGCQS